MLISPGGMCFSGEKLNAGVLVKHALDLPICSYSARVACGKGTVPCLCHCAHLLFTGTLPSLCPRNQQTSQMTHTCHHRATSLQTCQIKLCRADTNTASEVSPGSLLGAAVHCFVLFFVFFLLKMLVPFITFSPFFFFFLLCHRHTHTLTVAVWNHMLKTVASYQFTLSGTLKTKLTHTVPRAHTHTLGA